MVDVLLFIVKKGTAYICLEKISFLTGQEVIFDVDTVIFIILNDLTFSNVIM